ncbi:hypothetical protein MC885_008883 [Smutsia gigantea]|nr:hypothetical protein MC885_008883 [Smutsia gigantea]
MNTDDYKYPRKASVKRLKGHCLEGASAANCPYSEINLNKDRIFPDRLSGEMPPANPSFPRNKRTDTNEISSSPEIRDQHADDVKEDLEERTESDMRTSHVARGAREEPGVQQAQRRSAVFLSFKSPIPCLPLRWEQQSKLLPTVAGIPASKVSKWSTDEVGPQHGDQEMKQPLPPSANMTDGNKTPGTRQKNEADEGSRAETKLIAYSTHVEPLQRKALGINKHP